MSTFDESIARVQQAAAATGAILRQVRWRTSASGDDNTLVVAADCDSYAAMCDHLKAPRDQGRIVSDGHRIYDALTKESS